MKRICAGLLCLLLSPAGLARGPATEGGFVDLYYIPTADFGADFTDPNDPTNNFSGEIDGDGFGLRALARAGGEGLALSGEYQIVTYDTEDPTDPEADVDRLRLGLGVVGPSTSGAFAQYHKIEIEGGSEFDGWGAHGRLAGRLSPQMTAYAEAGYLFLKEDDVDFEGPEAGAGLVFQASGSVGVFADYRLTRIEAEEFGYKLELEFTDVRVGVRIALGG